MVRTGAGAIEELQPPVKPVRALMTWISNSSRLTRPEHEQVTNRPPGLTRLIASWLDLHISGGLPNARRLRGVRTNFGGSTTTASQCSPFCCICLA